MTWKEFKDEVDSRDVGDDDEITYIDVQVLNPKNIITSKRTEWRKGRKIKIVQIS